MAGRMKSKIYKRLQEQAETESMAENENLNKKPEKEAKGLYDEKTHNICTGGHPVDELSHKEYLKKFAEGPCNPTLLIPGLAGSKLIASIDCETLKEKEPDTFKSCGWSSCEKGNPKTPHPEYQIWIPDIQSDMSLFSLKIQNSQCFSNLVSLRYSEKKGKIVVKSPHGVRLDPIGETPKTRTNSMCGFASVEDLFKQLPIEIKAFTYFKEMRK